MVQLSPTVPFGEWLPDRPALGNQGALEARGVIPAEGAYRPVKSFEVIAHASAMTDSAFVAQGNDGSFEIITGEQGALRRWNGSGFDLAGGGYSGGIWDFAQWGDEVLAVNEDDGLLYAPFGGQFQTISNAPKARYVARVGDFVMLGAVDGDANRIQWSGFNNRDIWGIDRTNQADFNDMPLEFGAITGLTAEQYTTLFQERAITRISYIGPPAIFRLDTFEQEKGCIAPKSIITYGYYTFFISQDGPNIWDGQVSRPIANGKLRRWFFERFDRNAAVDISAAIDRQNNCVVWSWVHEGQTWLLFYSWEENRASYAVQDFESRAIFAAPASLSSDAAPIRFGEVSEVLGVISANGQFGTLSGENMEAMIETGEWHLEARQRSFVTEIWPVIDAPNGSLRGQIGARDEVAGDDLIFKTANGQAAAGFIPCRSSARVHRVRVTIPKGIAWTHAQGVQLLFNAEGKR